MSAQSLVTSGLVPRRVSWKPYRSRIFPLWRRMRCHHADEENSLCN
ncbi:MAG: hypothetical protein LBF66_02645 [Holosporales bacterium]|nr:hypothetical protein [Holosporales bacterium]